MINKIYNKKILIIIAILVVVGIFVIILNQHENEEIEIYETIPNEQENEIEKNDEEKNIVIHITGCVKKQGIVEVKEGARIVDVIEAADGVTEEADITKVNLAYVVKDAQKIYIPSIYDEEEIEYITMDNGENVIVEDKDGGKNNMININTATQTELEQLPGIGPSTALKIIDYREKNKKFNSIDEIKQVQGIGDAKFNNIKDMIEI